MMLCTHILLFTLYTRPSGTEDVVRVYAEASTLEEVKQLSLGVACLVYDMCGGVGERPV